jgi:undecaprenyl pyrophosphate synthase
MQLIDIRDATKSQREENAAAIRDLADQVERGDITECSIVANDIANNVYTCHLQFEDR